MDVRSALDLGLKGSEMIVNMYLGDLSDQDLLVRPVPGCNHIAWQLGHLIVSENMFTKSLRPALTPDLPAGFADKYSSANSKFDSAGAFDSKATLLQVMNEQRAGTRKALADMKDSEWEELPIEQFRGYCSNKADIFQLIGTHWMMHAGQWAVVRRKLGKPPLF